MTQAVAQRAFSAGELAPSLYARTDMQKYYIGCRTLRNMYVMRHGGATSRSGTQFITEVKNSANPVRLIPFEISTKQAYALEFGNLFVRFLTNGAYISLSATASAWVFPFAYFQGDTASAAGTNYVNITGNNPNTSPNLNPTDWYPLTGLIYELPTPYVVADLPEIRFAQRSGVLVLTHPTYAPRSLTRNADTNWALTLNTFAPLTQPPTSLAIGAGGSVGVQTYWAVTSVATETFEESIAATANALNKIPSSSTPTSISWLSPATGPVPKYYRVYRGTDGVSYGFVGQTSSSVFSDVGLVPDLFSTPPDVRAIFNAVDKYPTAVIHYQQRLTFGASNTEPETIWASRTAKFTNFTKTFPLQDDDAVTFTMVGRKLNAVKHLLDLGRLIAFTQNEEKLVEGDDAGILRPDAINPRKLAGNGTGTLRPLEVDDSAIYVQARNTIVRDLKPISEAAYQGTDLTVWAAHLFNGFTLVDWDFAKSPNSIVWAVRSDGTLLSLTYLREHDIYGWCRHDTDGTVENVCVVPEGSEDRVYLVVKRVINGVTRRYIERMASRFYSPLRPQDAFFVDCGVTFDGTNLGVTTISISGGVNWNETEQVTLTSSVAQFIAGDVGNVYVIILTDAAGNELSRVRMTVESFTSTTVVKARASGAIPAGLQNVARTTWQRAVKTLTQIGYLEGKSLSILADGYVVASPNNTDAAYPTITVVGGSITLPQPYTVIRLGLPYISDMQPLDLDLPGGATIKDKKLLVNEVGLYLERSRGVWIGDPNGPTTALPLKNLREWKARSDEVYGVPVSERTDFFKVKLAAEWGPGRFLVRQVDPLPLTILSATPIGYLPQ